MNIDIADYAPVWTADFTTMTQAQLNSIVAPHSLPICPAWPTESAPGQMTFTAHTPWNGDFGDAKFTDPGAGPNGGPFFIMPDGLHIRASKDAAGKWTSGLLAAADASGAGYGLQDGYFEACMQLPPGSGLWPAFWLSSLVNGANRSLTVELDVIEYHPGTPYDWRYSTTAHIWDRGWRGPHQFQRLTPVQPITSVPPTTVVPSPTPTNLTTGFNTFGVDIHPRGLTVFYLNRSPVFSILTPPEMRSPMYPLINLAAGSGFADNFPDPSDLIIKYIMIRSYDPDGRSRRI